MVRLDPQYHLVFGAGGELLATPDVARMEAAIAGLCPRRRGRLPPVPGGQPGEDGRGSGPCLESPFLRWRDLLSPQLLKMLPLLRPWLSLDGELRRYFQDPRVRLAMTFQSKYLGMSPFNCPSLFSILSFLEYEYGVFHPIGGCGGGHAGDGPGGRGPGRRDLAGRRGRGDPLRGPTAVGVRSDSGVHQADALVINADFARAMTRLVPDHLRRRWTDRKIARKRFSCSTFMIYLGSRAVTTTWPTTRSTWPRTTCRTSPTSRRGTLSVGRSLVLRAERLRDRPVAWRLRA